MISMNELSALANALVEAERDVESAEVVLKAKKETARRLREESLPLAMQEIGMTKVKLDSGETIEVKQDVFASIPAERKEAAYAWLESHDFGGLIKTAVSVDFGRGELDEAKGFFDKLREEGLAPDFSRSIHAQTLKAFLNEQIREGRDTPLDLFGAMPVFVAKVKR